MVALGILENEADVGAERANRRYRKVAYWELCCLGCRRQAVISFS